MFTSKQCLAKAEEMAAYGLTCPSQVERDGYANVAEGWRRTAVLAEADERWTELHPDP